MYHKLEVQPICEGNLHVDKYGRYD